LFITACIEKHCTWPLRLAIRGGGATRPLPRNKGVEELHGNPEICTNVSPPQRSGTIPAPLTRDGPKWRDHFSEGSDHSVSSNHLELSVVQVKVRSHLRVAEQSMGFIFGSFYCMLSEAYQRFVHTL